MDVQTPVPLAHLADMVSTTIIDDSDHSHYDRKGSTSSLDSHSPNDEHSKRKEEDDGGYAEPPMQRVKHNEGDAQPAKKGKGELAPLRAVPRSLSDLVILSGGGGSQRKPITAKRQEQNRCIPCFSSYNSQSSDESRRAQQAFRDRKEAHVHGLESQVAELTSKTEATETENAQLRDLIVQLREENARLASMTAPTSQQPNFTFPIASTSTSFPQVGASALDEGFMASLTGYATVSPPPTLGEALNPSLVTATQPDLDFALWRDPSSPSAGFPSTTFPALEDFLALDDGTTAPAFPSGPSSATSEPRTPSEQNKASFDEDGLCDQFKSKARCNEVRHLSHVVSCAERVDRAHRWRKRYIRLRTSRTKRSSNSFEGASRQSERMQV